LGLEFTQTQAAEVDIWKSGDWMAEIQADVSLDFFDSEIISGRKSEKGEVELN
jgi:hypothetical protein